MGGPDPLVGWFWPLGCFFNPPDVDSDCKVRSSDQDKKKKNKKNIDVEVLDNGCGFSMFIFKPVYFYI